MLKGGIYIFHMSLVIFHLPSPELRRAAMTNDKWKIANGK
jgi:hypothetical protein